MLEVDSKTNNIYLTRGDTAILGVTLKDSEGHPYVAHEGDSLKFLLTRKRGCGEYMIEKSIDMSTLVLEIEPNERI